MKKSIPENLRICFVTHKLPFFDRSTDYGYLWPLCRSLAKKGHDITVITSDSPDENFSSRDKNIHIHYLEGGFGEATTAFKESVLEMLEQLHVEKPFDIVHSVDNTGLYVSLYKKKLNVALATDVKGTHLDEIFDLLGLAEDTFSSYLKTSWAVAVQFLKSFFGTDRKIIRRSNGVFVTSQQQQDILERYYFYPSRKVHIIPYGIDSSTFQASSPIGPVFEKWGIQPGTKVILTVTPMVNAEVTKNLLTAFERVVIKKPNSALVIAGDGPRRKELEAHMLNLVLVSKVYFTGALPPEELSQMIQACDIYVNLNSKSSGFEATLLEAMASCKTVIASEVGTSANAIDSGVNGFLLRPTEIGPLSRLLLEAVSDQIDTASIGERARQKILKMFDNTRMVDQTIQAYRKILLATGKYRL